MAVTKDRKNGQSISRSSIVAIEDINVTSGDYDAGDNPARAIKLDAEGSITYCPANHSEDSDAVTETFSAGIWHPVTVRKILTGSAKKTGIKLGW